MSELIERARSMRTTILDAQSAMQDARRMPDALAQDFAQAGFFRMCVPRVYGGLEVEVLTLFETLEALSQTDASAAWCAMIGATTGLLGGYLPPAEAQTVFGDPLSIVTGVYAPLGKAEAQEESYLVSGRWKWNSGGQNARWLCGGCMIRENGAQKLAADGAPVHRMMIFPASAVTFIDTWRTTGLKGTGSGDMEVVDIEVPHARSVSLLDDTPHIQSPLYAFPMFGLLSVGIAAVACGNAGAALAEFGESAGKKRLPGGRTLNTRSTVQAAYAVAAANLHAARALMTQEIEAAAAESHAGAALAVPQRARIRLAATHLTRTAAESVRTIHDLAGGASVFLDDPLNRRLADAQTMTAHVMTGPATYELAGRALLGVAVNTGEL